MGKILNYLFIFTIVFLLPFGEIIRISPLTSVTFTLVDLGLVLLTLFWLIKKFLNKEGIKGKLKKPILIFIFVLLLSLLLNFYKYSTYELLVSLLYIVRWFLLTMVYFIVIDINNKENIKFFLIPSFIIIFLGYIQYLFYPNLKNLIYLGWDEHLYRMFSVYFDPNFASIIFTLIFTIWFIYFLKTKNLFYLIIVILSIGAILLTYSRTGLLALIVSIFTYFIFKKNIKTAIFISCLILLSLILLPKSFETEGTNFFRTASASERIKSMSNAISIFKDSPIYGIGYNAYRYAQFKKGTLNGTEWQYSHAGSGVENSYLLVLSTTGIIGVGAYLFLIYSIITLILKGKGFIKLISVSSVFAVLISGLLINSLFYSHILILFWSLIAINENTQP